MDERKGYVGKYYTKSNDCLRVVPRRTEMFLCLLFVFHVGGGVESAFKGVVADDNVFHPFQQEAFLVPMESRVGVVLSYGVFAECETVQ